MRIPSTVCPGTEHNSLPYLSTPCLPGSSEAGAPNQGVLSWNSVEIYRVRFSMDCLASSPRLMQVPPPSPQEGSAS